MADPLFVSMRCRDYLGRSTTTGFFLPSATSYVDAQAAATKVSLDLDLALGARVEDIRIAFPGVLNAGIKAIPTAGQQLYTAGKLVFNINGLSKGWSLLLPGLLESLLVGDKNINDGAPVFDALKADFNTGIDIGGGTFIQPVNPYGLDLTGFRSGGRAKRHF